MYQKCHGILLFNADPCLDWNRTTEIFRRGPIYFMFFFKQKRNLLNCVSLSTVMKWHNNLLKLFHCVRLSRNLFVTKCWHSQAQHLPMGIIDATGRLPFNQGAFHAWVWKISVNEISTSSYHHNKMESMNPWPLFMVRSLNNYIDGLVQEIRNSIVNALELRLSCTNISICVVCFAIFWCSVWQRFLSWRNTKK